MARSISIARLALVVVVGLAGLGGCSVVVGGVLNGKGDDAGVASDTGVPECTSGPQCDDTNPCTADTCMDRHCVNMPAFNGMACGDGLMCNMGACVPCPGGACVDPCAGIPCPPEQTCVGGVCVDPCAGIACPPGETCVGGVCSDPCTGIACPPPQTCIGGVCVLPTPCIDAASCDDSNDCTTDTCDPANGCIHTALDADDDGHPPQSCPGGDDCDDTNAAVHPGATEICNDVDDDCDSLVDNAMVTVTAFVDTDGDGFGGTTSTSFTTDCTGMLPAGLADNADDCDDTNANAHPYAGTAPFFNTPRMNGSFDYDCDGVDRKEYNTIACATGGPHLCTASTSCSGAPGTMGTTTCGYVTPLYNCAPCGTPTGSPPVFSCNVNTITTSITLKCH